MPTVKGGSTTTPYLPKSLDITLDNSGANGQEVRATNTRTSETVKGKVEGDTILLDLANTESGWANNDLVIVRTNGEYYGSATVTLDGNTGGQAVSLAVTLASTTNTVALT